MKVTIRRKTESTLQELNISKWGMRMARECHVQRATKEENEMENILSNFFIRKNDTNTKKNTTHNMLDIDTSRLLTGDIRPACSSSEKQGTSKID